MQWELSLPSSVVSTLFVLVLDVFALWLIDAALVRIAAYLNAREIYDRHNAVQISDVWFESMTGRSHGPMWFRRTQVVLKAVLLASSIAVGLSINSFDNDVFDVIPVRGSMLVRRERRISRLGTGNLPLTGDALNLSNEVRFVLGAQSCVLNTGDGSSVSATEIQLNAMYKGGVNPEQYQSFSSLNV